MRLCFVILLIQEEKVKAQREARAAVAKKKSSKKFRCSELNKVKIRVESVFLKTILMYKFRTISSLLFCAHCVTSSSGY